MAYDEELADRVRAAVSGVESTREVAMFGGLAFLVGGHLAVAVSGAGGLLARVDPRAAAELLLLPGVTEMEMGGRLMRGWLRVTSEAVDDEEALHTWVQRCVAHVRTMAPKKATSGNRPRKRQAGGR